MMGFSGFSSSGCVFCFFWKNFRKLGRSLNQLLFVPTDVLFELKLILDMNQHLQRGAKWFRLTGVNSPFLRV